MKMKMKMKRMMGLFLALAVSIGCLSLNPIASYANDANTKTFNINEGNVNITQSGNYTIEGTGNATTNTISVTGSNITATITLNNVNIDASNQTYNAAFRAKGYGQSNVHLTIILERTNSLKSGRSWAGLTWNNSNNNSTLKIKGDGSLTAIGGWAGAGIGGCIQRSGENITINGGTVTATGGRGAAGIGGGALGSGENITIIGGTVTAAGGDKGAGIGGGPQRSGENITITGGTVTATGGDQAAGIGGGGEGGPGKNITIAGGTVTATGGWTGAGIGGGASGSGENITINGGTVTAAGGGVAAGIGGGYQGSGENITIIGGTVTAAGGGPAAGIGGGYQGSGENIKITGGSVKASRISTTPTDDNGHSVYLAKLENQDGVNEVTVYSGTGNAKTFKRAGSHPDRDTAFYLYLTGQDHDLDTSKGRYKAKWNGNTNAFTTKFNPNDVRSMSVTSQPSKLTYTEDDKLDLSGLVVTLEDGQGFTRDVKPADFTANDIKAAPENGAELKLANNGKKVKLTRGSLAAETSNALTVNERVFDPHNVKTMTVASQPTRLTYTEDDKLDLTGLVVKLTDDHGKTKEVKPADFTANDIKATPENGAELKLANSGKKVTLKRGNLAAETTNTLTVNERVFDPHNVKTMTVTSQPTNLKYTAGDKLDLSGLVVTLIDGHNLTKEVTPAEFEANGIKANPENGTELTVADHNDKAVKLTKDGVSAVETEKLTVNAISASADAEDLAAAEAAHATVAMYRLYNTWTHEHLFTTDKAEYDNLVAAGWTGEGEIDSVAAKQGKGVYRLYNPYTHEHHYTSKEDEVADCVKAGWVNEGIKFHSVQNGTVPVYSMYNPNEQKFYHHYTSDPDEIAKMVKDGWIKEEIKWYATSKK